MCIIKYLHYIGHLGRRRKIPPNLFFSPPPISIKSISEYHRHYHDKTRVRGVYFTAVCNARRDLLVLIRAQTRDTYNKLPACVHHRQLIRRPVDFKKNCAHFLYTSMSQLGTFSSRHIRFFCLRKASCAAQPATLPRRSAAAYMAGYLKMVTHAILSAYAVYLCMCRCGCTNRVTLRVFS